MASSINGTCAVLRREKYEDPGRFGYDLEEDIGVDSCVAGADKDGGLVMDDDPIARDPVVGSRR